MRPDASRRAGTSSSSQRYLRYRQRRFICRILAERKGRKSPATVKAADRSPTISGLELLSAGDVHSRVQRESRDVNIAPLRPAATTLSRRAIAKNNPCHPVSRGDGRQSVTHFDRRTFFQ